MNHFNLQMFADGENNEQSIRSYAPQFRALLPAVFNKKAYFADFFDGGLMALDGITHSKNAFTIKTCDLPVTIGTYSKDANTAFGTGTGKSTRFGNRAEVIYQDIDVPYTWTWAFHEGIDRTTVNENLDSAVAARFEAQALAKVQMFNQHHAQFISKSAGTTIPVSESAMNDITRDDELMQAFDKLAAHFVNVEATDNLVVKVCPDVYNALINGKLTTTAKNSSINVDENGLVRFKGFTIEQVPARYFGDKEIMYAYAAHVAKAFTGINTSRTIESEDFDGLALQGEGKAGEYIPEDNKKAVVKVTASAA